MILHESKTKSPPASSEYMKTAFDQKHQTIDKVGTSAKKKTSVKDIIVDAARRTSVHGIGEIVATKRISSKLLWTAVVIVSFGE